MTPEQVQRFARHLVLKEIGGPGQSALLASKVAIVGAGGLGGPAALYLAAAGVGSITIIDDDAVDLSNLQRQVQFGEGDIGLAKAEALSNTLKKINSATLLNPQRQRLSRENAKHLLGHHSVILDGTDNFDARFSVNQAALALKIPLVSGALGRFDAQLSAFRSDHESPCYQCLVPANPPELETCAEIGVVGALAGIAGSMMALETIKIITGAGEPLFGKVWLYDGLKAESRTVRLSRDPGCQACSHHAKIATD